MGRWIFWVAAVTFVVWDFAHSAPVNVRLEPPMVTVGSGVPSDAGFCAILK